MTPRRPWSRSGLRTARRRNGTSRRPTCPTAWVRGFGAPPNYYGGEAHRITVKFGCGNRNADDLGHLTCNAAFYLVGKDLTYQAQYSDYVFSTEGDNVAVGTATLMESQAGIDPGQATILMSDLFPPGKADAIPNTPWCDVPDPTAVWPDNTDTSTGYDTNFAFLVLDFGVPGGFEYV